MKKIINSLKRTHWFKVSVAFLTCLLFLAYPSCQKDELNQDSLLNMDKMSVSALSASSSAITYIPMRNWQKGGEGGVFQQSEDLRRPWFENFQNFVLKVQNTGGSAKISTLEIRIKGVLILTAKSLNRDYFAAKTLRNLSNGEEQCQLSVTMTGDQGCSISWWIEGTLKVGTAYGKHLYYKTRQWRTWDETTGLCWGLNCYPVIINDARENNFLLNLYTDRNFFIGLTDLGHEQKWYWYDNTLNRTVDWKFSECGWPNQDCPGAPIPWGNTWCTIRTDYGFNNWGNGQPDNGGGGCDDWQLANHRDESVAVIGNDGTWMDVPATGDDRDRRNCVLEWDFIPLPEVLCQLLNQEFPGYPN